MPAPLLPGNNSTDSTTNTPLNENDSLGRFADQTQLYTDSHIRNRYQFDGHKYMAGITSTAPFNGSSVAFVQLAATTLLWVSDWTAASWSNQPLVPTPFTSDSRWQILDYHLEPGVIRLAADGFTPLYRLSGTYYYGCTSPDISLIVFGRPPWMTDNFPNGRSMPVANFLDGFATLGTLSRVTGGGSDPTLGPTGPVRVG